MVGVFDILLTLPNEIRGSTSYQGSASDPLERRESLEKPCFAVFDAVREGSNTLVASHPRPQIA